MGIKGLFKHLFLIAFVVSLSACGGGESSSGETKTIVEEQKSPTTNLVFTDQALADCVQNLIDTQGYTLVEQISELTCSGQELEQQITDIEGIQKLFNLEILDLSNNQIRDITPIAELTKLKSLNLSNNDIQITTPIQELPALEQLDLSENNSIICGMGYDQLKENYDLPACIDGQGEQSIEDIFNGKDLQSCIEQTVQEIKDKYKTETIYPKQITQLKCVKQDISSIEGIDQLENLRELDLSHNNISDITLLKDLTQLKRVLLGQNIIENLPQEIKSIYMQELRLDNNQITTIEPINALKALKQLHLTNNSIRDLTPIQGLTELLELRISNNRIIDIGALANLKKLSSLWIQGNQIAKIDAIAQISNLDQLWISNNWLTDLSPLQTQTKLRWLHLDGTEAQDLTPLNSLTQLEWLQLNNTRVEDIIAIYPLTKLNWLHLKGNNTIPCSQLDHMEEIITAEKIDRPETCSQAIEGQGTPISTIEFQDQALRDCVYDAAKEQGIINTNELTALSCPSQNITNIEELQQLPELQTIDLTGNDNIACTQLEQFGEDILMRPDDCNHAPVINVTESQSITAGQNITIYVDVTDVDDNIATYNWVQISGDTVELSNPNSYRPTFTAPQKEQPLTFQLTVTDEYGLTATQTITVVVTAEVGNYQLTVSKQGVGQGSVSSYPEGIDCGATCQYEYISDTIVMLTATPDEGSVFNGWSDNCEVSENQCHITMDQAHTVTADFTIQPPQNVMLEAGDSQIRVNWDEVAGATGYTIYWGTSAGIDPTDSDTYIGSQTVENTPYTITGLDNNTEYYVVVTAKIGSTNESAASAELSSTCIAELEGIFVHEEVSDIYDISYMDNKYYITDQNNVHYTSALEVPFSKIDGLSNNKLLAIYNDGDWLYSSNQYGVNRIDKDGIIETYSIRNHSPGYDINQVGDFIIFGESNGSGNGNAWRIYDTKTSFSEENLQFITDQSVREVYHGHGSSAVQFLDKIYFYGQLGFNPTPGAPSLYSTTVTNLNIITGNDLSLVDIGIDGLNARDSENYTFVLAESNGHSLVTIITKHNKYSYTIDGINWIAKEISEDLIFTGSSRLVSVGSNYYALAMHTTNNTFHVIEISNNGETASILTQLASGSDIGDDSLEISFNKVAVANGELFAVGQVKNGGDTYGIIQKVFISNDAEEDLVKFVPLNDTGITRCANETDNDLNCAQEGYPNQDAEHGRDALAMSGELTKVGDGEAGFDFTKICNSGEVAGEGDCPAEPILGPGANQWACTRDNVTGFMWEVKTDDDGLRDKDNTYTWYNPDPNNNRGNAGIENYGICPDEGNCDTEKYAASVNAQGLCGYNNWRMPNVEELRSIVDYNTHSPAIDTAYFPNTLSSYYWSASPDANSYDNAWLIYFSYGSDDYSNKYHRYYVRLVRTVSN